MTNLKKRITVYVILAIIVIVGGTYYLHNKDSGIEPLYYLPIPGAQEFSTDNKHVYYFGNIVKGANPKTAVRLNESFFVDTNKAFVTNIGYGDSVLAREIPGVDRASFQVIDEEYAKDKYRVYSVHGYSIIVEGADPKIFQKIGGEYAKDALHVYTRGIAIGDVLPADYQGLLSPEIKIPTVTIDAPTFAPVDDLARTCDRRTYDVECMRSEEYFKDKNHVYVNGTIEKSDGGSYLSVTEADPETFMLYEVKRKDGSFIADAKDAHHRYLRGVRAD